LQYVVRVVRTSKLSTNAAATHFKVPRRTLRTYSVENKQSISKMRGKIVLSPQQVKELSKRIIRLAQTGYPKNLKILRMCVFTNCEKNNILSQFVKEKGMAGRAWVEGIFALSSHYCIPQSTKSYFWTSPEIERLHC